MAQICLSGVLMNDLEFKTRDIEECVLDTMENIFFFLSSERQVLVNPDGKRFFLCSNPQLCSSLNISQISTVQW